MPALYLFINIAVIAGPLALSFDKRVSFFRTWKALFIAILVMMIIYISWDMIFVRLGIWGFNQHYLTNIHLGNLPLEEVLFFITVPYACTFIYACIKHYFDLNMSNSVRNILIGVISALLLLIMYLGRGQYYSFYASLCSLITLLVFIYLIDSSKFWINFLVSFIISMVPFFFVNGLLTGTGIEDQIVWYNSAHIFNLRMLTIPVEDGIYNFGMLLLTIGSYERLSELFAKSASGYK